MTRLLLALVVLGATLASAAGAQSAFPTRIDLPNGFQPEGIAVAGEQFYVGSIPTGAVYRGSLRTGKGAVLVPAAAGSAAIGLKVDRGRLFVAGGPTGNGYVYNARSGALMTSYAFAGGFVNDVVVTKRAAWFTDSSKPLLYRVPLGPNGRPGASFTSVNLTGDYSQGTGFNVNGIDATPNGKTLVTVQSSTGKLFLVTPAGATTEIDLGGQAVQNGDGILLLGRTLYVVRNSNNEIAVVALGKGLATGTIARTITHPGFDVPTTIDRLGSRLYAVNARFGTTPTPTTEYTVVQLRR